MGPDGPYLTFATLRAFPSAALPLPRALSPQRWDRALPRGRSCPGALRASQLQSHILLLSWVPRGTKITTAFLLLFLPPVL